MLVYLMNTGVVTDISKKEEITEDTVFITDQQLSDINLLLDNNLDLSTHVWVTSDGTLHTSGLPPSDTHVFNTELKSWVIDDNLVKDKLDRQRKMVWSQIKELRDLYNSKPAKVVLSEDKSFYVETDIMSLNLFNGQFNMFQANLITNSIVKSSDNVMYSVNFEELKIILTSIYSKIYSNFNNAEVHLSNINKSESPLEYDFSTGWV